MKKEARERCSDVGMWVSLLCASLGALLALGLVTALLGFKFLFEPEIRGGLTYGSLALFLSAAVLGRLAGTLTCRWGTQDPRAGVIGIVLAVSCLAVSTLAGSVIGYLELHGDAGPFGDYIFKSLFWVAAFGIFPAIGLGVLFTSLMEKAISGVEARGDA